MLIKYQDLAAHLTKKWHGLYVIVGQDHYLMNDAAYQISCISRQQRDVDHKTINLATPADWSLLLEEANSYSLFAEQVLIVAHWSKKTIDKAGKETLKVYLKNINPRCQIILHAPNVPVKQIQWLANEKDVLAVQAYSFAPLILKKWIITQLQKHAINFDPNVPALIQQYTQGNMLACAQAIEKLALVYDQNTLLSLDETQDHLIDQCDYQLYELTDACLAAQPEKAIHLLRQAHASRKEPTLILWLLVQEIRLLIQLSCLVKQANSINAACLQLKIWPQKIKLYQSALSRLPTQHLYQLLQTSKQLDDKIKSNQSHQIWHWFERLALGLCVQPK